MSRQQSCMSRHDDQLFEGSAAEHFYKSPQRMESHPSLDQLLVLDQSKNKQGQSRLIETIKEIGDGLTSKIYLARDRDGRFICVKVYKQGMDVALMNSPEEEYRVSQLLGSCPNIVKIFAFER